MYLDLKFYETRCNVVAASGQVAAVLNMKTFRSFTQCQKNLRLRLQATTQLSSWFKQLSGPETGTEPRYCEMNVLVFGYRHEADSAAVRLAAQRLYLQDPDHVPLGFSYENPQCLELPPVHVQIDLPSNSPAVPRLQPTDELGFVQGDKTEIDFDIMLNTFACHDGLVQASAVAQVSTTLLRCMSYTTFTSNANMLLATREKVWTSFCNRSRTLVPHLEAFGYNSKASQSRMVRQCM